MGRRIFKPRLLVVLAALVIAATALAACGGGDSSSSSSVETGGGAETSTENGGETTAETSGDDVKAEAAKLVAEEETPPPRVYEDQPLKNTNIPKGKTVSFVGCGTPQCENYFRAIDEASKALGWTAKARQGNFEPNKLVAELEEVVAEKPDVFIACCISPTIANKFYKQMKEEGTIVVTCCTKPQDTEGLTKLLSPPPLAKPPGEHLADYMLAEKGDELNAVFLQTEEFEVVRQYTEGFEDEIKRLCPECPVDVLNVAGTDIGKPVIPTTVVSYLRAHPDVNYLGVFFSNLAIGVPSAMKAAGIEDVYIGTSAADETALEAVRDEKEFWKVGQSFGIEWGLQGLNVAVRTMMNEPIDKDPTTPSVLISAKNAPQFYTEGVKGQPFVIADAVEQYEELWGLK